MAADREPIRIEPCQRRVRTFLGGELVADTHDARLVWEVPYYPAYYLPLADVRRELLAPSGRTRTSRSGRGEAQLFDIRAGGRTVEDAAWQYADSPEGALRELVRFDWKAMDRWLEEDEEVIVHPRNPYTRVDVLPSSRRVKVVVNGVEVADTRRAMALFETGRPVRWYVPQEDIRMDLLEPTSSRTGCPYKGWASYWTVSARSERHEDVAWAYLDPLPESSRIASLICIWDTDVQTYVDGELEAAPST
ncbi:MAG: DUF427 domain-containing protein [Acidimicrobiia bacterium]|nr:DUF427 domain-containing protein [Acidimicrobiia bacterium]